MCKFITSKLNALTAPRFLSVHAALFVQATQSTSFGTNGIKNNCQLVNNGLNQLQNGKTTLVH